MFDTDPYPETRHAVAAAAAPSGAGRRPWMTHLFLRVGVGLLLLTHHAMAAALGAFEFLWNERPWNWVSLLHQAGLPYPTLLAPVAALVLLGISLSFLFGFLTRLFAVAFLLVLVLLQWRSDPAQSLQSELIWLYQLCGLTLMLFGSGRISIDQWLGRRESTPKRPLHRTLRP